MCVCVCVRVLGLCVVFISLGLMVFLQFCLGFPGLALLYGFFLGFLSGCSSIWFLSIFCVDSDLSGIFRLAFLNRGGCLNEHWGVSALSRDWGVLGLIWVLDHIYFFFCFVGCV